MRRLYPARVRSAQLVTVGKERGQLVAHVDVDEEYEVVDLQRLQQYCLQHGVTFVLEWTLRSFPVGNGHEFGA